VIHIDIIVVDVVDVWGILLYRKVVAMLGGTLEMDLTYINVPMNDETIIHLLNVPMTKIHVQEIGDDIGTNKTNESVKESLPSFSPDDMSFATKEYFDQI
jgi:hypothetical protein